jgi:hypothetical protein
MDRATGFGTSNSVEPKNMKAHNQRFCSVFKTHSIYLMLNYLICFLIKRPNNSFLKCNFDNQVGDNFQLCFIYTKLTVTAKVMNVPSKSSVNLLHLLQLVHSHVTYVSATHVIYRHVSRKSNYVHHTVRG